MCWREALRQECLEEVTNLETINTDLEDKDNTNEFSSYNVICAIEDIVNMVEDITIRSKKKTSMRKYFHC